MMHCIRWEASMRAKQFLLLTKALLWKFVTSKCIKTPCHIPSGLGCSTFKGNNSMVVDALFNIPFTVCGGSAFWLLFCYAITCSNQLSLPNQNDCKTRKGTTFNCLLGLFCLLVFFESSSQCCGLGSNAWLWYLLIIFTYFFTEECYTISQSKDSPWRTTLALIIALLLCILCIVFIKYSMELANFYNSITEAKNIY